jgi:hypothetical protein
MTDTVELIRASVQPSSTATLSTLVLTATPLDCSETFANLIPIAVLIGHFSGAHARIGRSPPDSRATKASIATSGNVGRTGMDRVNAANFVKDSMINCLGVAHGETLPELCRSADEMHVASSLPIQIHTPQQSVPTPCRCPRADVSRFRLATSQRTSPVWI